MRKINWASIPVALLLTACSFNVSMQHSDRSNASSDTLDDNQTDNPNIAPSLTIPVK